MAIVLIGFMGAGKSTIGTRLAELLVKPFIDIDSYIESSEQRTIAQIFDEDGEAYFRLRENEVLSRFIEHDIIIATGGGIIENPNNLELLKKNKLNIWVDTNINTMYNRIVNDFNRPNAKNRSYQEINNLYQSRLSRYNEIAYIKVNSECSVDQCIDNIKEKLYAED